jgi:hypothetical protein
MTAFSPFRELAVGHIARRRGIVCGHLVLAGKRNASASGKRGGYMHVQGVLA